MCSLNIWKGSHLSNDYSRQVEEQWQRDLVYLCAVAKYKLGRYLAAREQLTELLKVRLGLRVLRHWPW